MHRPHHLIAMMIACLLPAAAAQAQQTTTAPKKPDVPAVKRAATPKPPAAPSAKPAATPQRANAPAPARVDTSSTRTIDARPVPREQPASLGRLTVPGGSLGYEGQTQMKAYDMSDGRRVPGYDNIMRNDSSYFGLSLRMQTDSLSSPFRRHGVGDY